MTYDPTRRPRHPVQVAELNDAAALSALADRLDDNLTALSTAGARSGVIHAITILRGTARQITP